VNMPKAKMKDLGAVGATTGSTPFNLALNCDPGVNVAVTLTDATTPSNRSSTLTLTADSSASGVGYQISYANVPVLFGADSAAVGNANQISVSSSPTAGGVFTVPLTASYIRTGTVVPGSANARATFTMSYQ
jgi:type 1 fimbria pilin